MTPGPGGGHEHIHCSLKRLDPAEQQQPERPLAVVAAKYYFNGDSNVVFRYRLYSFHACPPNTPGARGEAVMRLWRLLPHVEARLRTNSYDLTSFSWSDDDNNQREPGRGSDDASSERCSKEGRTGDDVRGAGGDAAGGGGPPPVGGKSFVGLMGEDDGGTWVESQNVDGLEILVKDDLRLWPDRLWVNDRGFDRQGNFVYGNQRDVPYKMRR
ncbi:unnamed protein product, partial [Ectocarpus sp. 12 AP-2014]